MKKVVTFGELQLRLETPGLLRFCQTNQFQYSFGGSEANTAIGLVNFGIPASYVTKLPHPDMGRVARSFVHSFGVETQHIVMGEGRMAVYFFEKGNDLRPNQTISDRRYSNFSLSSPEEYDWEAIFEGADWFHFTAITPALGSGLPAACKDACAAAKARGMTVSCDLNYRSVLWTAESARTVMESLMPYVDVLIANQEHAKQVFGIDVPSVELTDSAPDYSGCQQMAQALAKRYSLQKVVITLRGTITQRENLFGAVLCENDVCTIQTPYRFRVDERTGAGDAFTAGFLYGCKTGMSGEDALHFGAASCAFKHSVPGDVCIASVSEVAAIRDKHEPD